jgi:AcrR family transcriptional regulator
MGCAPGCARRLTVRTARAMFRTVVRKSNGGSSSAGVRRARRQLATRQAILRAAAGVFRARGFAETGMREIAEAADLSTANLYYYFPSKADILYFCQDHSVGRMLEAVRLAGRGGAGAAERLRGVVTAHLLCTLDELDGAAAHTEVEALPARLRARIVAKRDRYERAVRAIVAGGMRQGAFAATDAALVTRALLGACNWTTRWYRPGGRLTPARIARIYADYLVRGLLP